MSKAAPQLVSLDAIAEELRRRIRDLIGEWKLEGKIEGQNFVARNPLRADRHLGSFLVAIGGRYQGMVRDFADAKSWSPLSFTADLWFSGDIRQAIQWAKSWLALDAAPIPRRAARAAAAEGAEKPDEAAAAKRASAYKLWLSAQASLGDTPVEAYLEGRGLAIRRLPYALRRLRYLSRLEHRPSGRDFPAMLGLVCDFSGRFLGIHRTYLDRLDGEWGKAGVAPNKMVLGASRGGFVPVWTGIAIDPATGEIRAAPKLKSIAAGAWIDVTEGIEDALSVAIAMPEKRVLAAISVGNLAAIAFPENVAGITIWAQNDPPESPAAAAIEAATEKLLAAQKRVRIVRPPQGVKDVNDYLRAAS